MGEGMTPQELDAIRARHQPVAGLRDDEGHLFEPATFCRHCVTLWPCDTDRVLAEVDRLRDFTGERQSWDDAVRAERVRIRAAVEGLPVADMSGVYNGKHFTLDYISRAAVLAAIDGGEK